MIVHKSRALIEMFDDTSKDMIMHFSFEFVKHHTLTIFCKVLLFVNSRAIFKSLKYKSGVR